MGHYLLNYDRLKWMKLVDNTFVKLMKLNLLIRRIFFFPFIFIEEVSELLIDMMWNQICIKTFQDSLIIPIIIISFTPYRYNAYTPQIYTGEHSKFHGFQLPDEVIITLNTIFYIYIFKVWKLIEKAMLSPKKELFSNITSLDGLKNTCALQENISLIKQITPLIKRNNNSKRDSIYFRHTTGNMLVIPSSELLFV